MLRKLINAFGVSGNEKEVSNIIKKELNDFNYDIQEDSIENIIIKLGEPGSKFMICCNIDQIGFIVLDVEKNGLIKVKNIGHLDINDIKHSFVRFENGLIGKLICYDNEKIYIDIGIYNKEKVLENIKKGDIACLIGPSLNIGDNNVVSPNLENRIGCYILLEILKQIKNVNNKEVYFVFSTQGKLNARGLKTAVHNINPDYCIIVNLKEVKDFNDKVKLGCGPILRLLDKKLIMHEEVKEILEQSSKRLNIDLQYSISNDIAEGAEVHKEMSGIKSGEVSIPCKYINSASEMVSFKDIEDTIKLIKGIL
ncbi:M42 family peptidase [Clostridium acetireducens]|nr:M42 family peptidase [Clostridium acetireducens]